jgi:hypothetical protein
MLLPKALRSLTYLMVCHERSFHRAHGRHRDHCAFVGQIAHELIKALALGAAQQIGGRHAHVLEEQFRGVLRLHAHLVENPPDAKSLEVRGFHHDDGGALGARAGLRLDHQRNQFRKKSIGDEYLRAVDEVIVAIATARVFSPCRSEPAPGSVMPMAPISSPRAMRGRKRCFCSSVP